MHLFAIKKCKKKTDEKAFLHDHIKKMQNQVSVLEKSLSNQPV